MFNKEKNLKIWTSNSSYNRFNELVKFNVLPIPIIGITKDSPLAPWRNTMIHFLNLCPPKELWADFKEGKIEYTDFEQNYLRYLWRETDVFSILRKLEVLTHLAWANGVAILGGPKEGDDPTLKVITEYFNRLGILEKEVSKWDPSQMSKKS